VARFHHGTPIHHHRIAPSRLAVHYYTDGRNGSFAVQDPLVLGHEAAGIITAIGPDVSPALNLKLGDRVAIECGKACGHRHSLPSIQTSLPATPSSTSSDSDDDGTAVSSDGEHDHIEEEGDKSGSDIECDYCSNGRYNLCGNMRFCSSAKTYPHLDGTLQTSMNHSANLLHRYAPLSLVRCFLVRCFLSCQGLARHRIHPDNEKRSVALPGILTS